MAEAQRVRGARGGDNCAPSGQWRRRRCLAAGGSTTGARSSRSSPGTAFYFKVDDENRPRFAARGLEAFVYR